MRRKLTWIVAALAISMLGCTAIMVAVLPEPTYTDEQLAATATAQEARAAERTATAEAAATTVAVNTMGAASATACRHFRNVMGDIASGALADGDIRAKVQEIDRSAAHATTGIRNASAQMLQDVGRGEWDAFVDSAGWMSSACDSIGQ